MPTTPTKTTLSARARPYVVVHSAEIAGSWTQQL
jgi:hypothetical protein